MRRNEMHCRQWRVTLQAYAELIRNTPEDRLDTEAVLETLAPLWKQIPVTASRLRGRIEHALPAMKWQSRARRGAALLRTNFLESVGATTRRAGFGFPAVACQ